MSIKKKNNIFKIVKKLGILFLFWMSWTYTNMCVYMCLTSWWPSNKGFDGNTAIFLAMSVRLYGCITWTLTKCQQKKIDGNYIRIPHAVLKKQYKTAAVWPLTSNLTNHPSKTSCVLLEHGCTSVGWPVKTYINQLFADTWCHLEDFKVMADKDGWWERVKRICA